jgi:hypothetical protein
MRTSFLLVPNLLAVAVLALAPVPSWGSSHDPTRTVTIYLHGFEREGSERHGIYGEDIREPLADSVAALVGLPVAAPQAPLPPNAVVGTTYYGDTPPAYYSAADQAELDAVTTQWGGGVPRYALIVAKYARHVLQRSGAQQVNLVSASFGALVARWIIEKDVESLASEGKIARWLTIEGVVAGNWAASHDEAVDLLSLVGPEPIDVLHMQYSWVDANLGPRADASHPSYAGILIGHVASTDDRGNGGALRDAMLVLGEYQPNDGVQSVPDATFRTVAAAARFQGRSPTIAFFHADHLGLADHRAAWVEAGLFLTATRRVTVTLKSARVTNLHEASSPWWDWRPAEILFETRAFSPAAQTRWAITEPLSARIKDGAAPPLVRYSVAGDTRPLSQVVFDDFVPADETALRLDLHAWEVDYDARYGVVETAQTPYHDDLGGGSIEVSTLASGFYTFTRPDWSGEIEVQIQDYPFQSLVGVSGPPRGSPSTSLAIAPQPAFSWARITAPRAEGRPDARATLEILDLSGRMVRAMEGPAGRAFLWDSRDSRGTPVPAGIYLARMRTQGGTRTGRICLVR